jgi:hypothetical protein
MLSLLAPQSPLVAYRTDLTTRPDGQPFSEDDGSMIATALRLTTAADHLADGDAAVHAALAYGRGGEQPADSVQSMLAADLSALEQMQVSGALHLAHTALVAHRRIAETIDPLLAGRGLALEARIAWKYGAHDVADSLYRELTARARTINSPELAIRARIGFAILAQLRGNYPKVRLHAGHALRLATQNDLPALRAIAHQVLMRAAVAASDWSNAIVHGWRAFSATSTDADGEAETMLNLSQLLFDVGRIAAAIHGFRWVLAGRRAIRTRLPALGGAARAAAALGRVAEARSLVLQLLDEAVVAPVRYDAAAALVEAAEAASVIGDGPLSGRADDAAQALIERYGYHELRFRLATPRPTPVKPLALRPDAEQVAITVETLSDDAHVPVGAA